MQKFWDMVLSHFLSFTVVVLEVMIFQNKKSVVLEVGKNHKDCYDNPHSDWKIPLTGFTLSNFH